MDALFPPGPQKSLLFGDAPHFKQNPLDFMLQSARTYGDLVHFRFGPAHAYLLTNPRDAHHVLVEHHDQFTETLTLTGALTSAMGHDLFAPKDRVTKRPIRRGAFQTRWLENQVDGVVHSAAQSLENWQGGNPLELLETITGQFVAATLWGEPTRTDRVIRLQRALAAQRGDASFQSPLTAPTWIPTANNRKRNKASATVRRLVNDILTDQRATHQPCILEYLLLGGGRVESAVAEMLALFHAGHEAAAQLLAWAWALLAANTEAAEALQNEVDTVLGSRLPIADDLPNLTYCEMVLKETLRLHPSTWLITRQAKRETRLGEYYLPAGSAIFISPYIIHHSPRYFTSPEHFLPERFSPDATRRGAMNAYLPFGAGGFASVQHEYAMTIGKLVLALAAQRFRLTMSVKPAEGSTYAAAPGGLQLHPQSVAAAV